MNSKMPRFASLLAGVGASLAFATLATAAPIAVTFTGTINSTLGDLSQWDTWTDIPSSDIFVGQTVNGQVVFDPALAPPDQDATANFFANLTAPTIAAGNASRWLTSSLSIGGNVFSPASEPFPPGTQTPIPSGTPGLSSNANQWLARTDTPFPSLPTLTATFFFDDWDTYFDGVPHDRQFRLSVIGCTHADAMPTTPADFDNCLISDPVSGASNGEAFVRAGDGDLGSGGPVGGFLYELNTLEFSFYEPPPVSEIPEPTSLSLLGLGLAGLGFSRRRRGKAGAV